ncbi:MAG: hypothetical protein PWP65_945 [Clostridia bacterium]|nr:hypothetical protein [Clostridia bacterium]
MKRNVQAQAEPRYTLLAATLASFLTPFMGSSINLAIPAIGAEFQAEALTLNWVVTAFLLTSAAFLLPIGRLADLYGRKRIFLTGIASYTLFSLLSAASPSLPFLILMRALHGISCSMIFGTAVAILTSAYPAKERGRVLGINAAAVYAGLSTGPFLGGILTHYLGWRSLFGVNALVGLITMIIAFTKLEGEWVGAKGEKFDLPGSALSILSLVALIYGSSTFSLGAQNKWFLLLGIIGLLVFILHENSTRFPLLNVRLFSSNTAFAFSNLAALINYSATFAVSFLISLYLQVVKGLNPQTAGLILLTQPLVQVFLSPLAGRLSDKIEPRIISSAGMALTSLGLFVFALVTPSSPINLVIGNLVLLGLGFSLFASPNTNAVMSSVSKAHYGIASSTLGTMRLLGQAFSMAIVAIIFSFYFRGMKITPAATPFLTKGMHAAFLTFGALSVGGIFASLARGKIH